MIKVQLCSWWGGDEQVAHQAWASSYEKEVAEAKSWDDALKAAAQ